MTSTSVAALSPVGAALPPSGPPVAVAAAAPTPAATNGDTRLAMSPPANNSSGYVPDPARPGVAVARAYPAAALRAPSADVLSPSGGFGRTSAGRRSTDGRALSRDMPPAEGEDGYDSTGGGGGPDGAGAGAGGGLLGGARKRARPFADTVREAGLGPALGGAAGAFLRDNWGILVFLAFCAVGLALLGVLAFDPLPWKAWVAFSILVLLLALLIKNSFPTQVAMLLALLAMLAFKVVTPVQALVGFSNTGVATVAVLFVVAEGIQRTSVLLPVFRVLLGKPKSLWVAQLRLMVPVAAASAFLNNTPVVTMMIPVVQGWSRRAGFPIAKLLMPMNNAAILGGTVTLLGTSTSLVVKALAEADNLEDESGNPVNLTIFGIAKVGLPSLVVGIVYMLIFSRCLLRDRGTSSTTTVTKNPREYTVALLVESRSPIVNESVTDAGLRQLQGLFLIEITRATGEVLPAVAPETLIEAGDTLLFAGIVETVTELYHINGLVPATGQSSKLAAERHKRRLVEVVISPTSLLVGRSVKESKFRSRFQAAIIAVHRRGTHVRQKIADILLAAGDTLLLETSTEFMERHGRNSNFALVSEVSGSQPPREDRLHMALSAFIATAMVLLATVGGPVYPLLTSASLAAAAMLITSCLTLRNAGDSVSIPVILTVATSFGVSKGLEVSGGAAELADFIVRIFRGLGNRGLLFGIYLSTAILSSLITNNAAVALVFPIAKTIIQSEGLNTLAALYTIMLAASASFSTPIGYTTNLLVDGPGGYHFVDWLIFGFPLQIVLAFVAVFLCSFFYQ